jgi:hypothetical protein
MRRLLIGFKNGGDGNELGIDTDVSNGKPSIPTNKGQRNVHPRFAAAVGHFVNASKRLFGRLLMAVPLPPGAKSERCKQGVFDYAFGDGQGGHERLAAKEKWPDGSPQSRVQPFQKRPVAFETDEEVGIREVEALAEDGFLGALGGIGAANILGRMIVPHQPALAVHPDGHYQRAKVGKRLLAWTTESGAEQTDHAGTGGLAFRVALTESATGAPALHWPSEAH